MRCNTTYSALILAEETRSQIIASTAEKTRVDFSQYLTPYQTASLAASLFSESESNKRLNCLDLGAGTGILSVALAERYGQKVHIDCIELDSVLAAVCDRELSKHGISHQVHIADALNSRINLEYDRVILNPPYKKMAANDIRQKNFSVRSPNLYSAFLMVAIRALKSEGECVAIIPRSWMNGQYFQPFRYWLLSNCSIDSIHIYGSRTDIFSDTNVLQETMLIKLSKRPQSQIITVSESHNNDCVPTIRQYPVESLVDFGGDLTIRVSPSKGRSISTFASLRQSGLCASTGKVVDFRSREALRTTKLEGLNRLIYACNFSEFGFTHPVNCDKPQWIDCSTEKYSKQLIPSGCYVVVKRFSSKEESRRIKAYLLELSEPEALENHLNYIHAGTPRKTIPLDYLVARGLTLWLSSSEVESWFRARSGSTQVNASDLNALPTPSLEQLIQLGQVWRLGMSQIEVDATCNKIQEQ